MASISSVTRLPNTKSAFDASRIPKSSGENVETLPRWSTESMRSGVFSWLREMNERLLRLEPALTNNLMKRADKVRRALESNQIAESREFFYALQPRERLQTLADRLRQACDLNVS